MGVQTTPLPHKVVVVLLLVTQKQYSTLFLVSSD